jgi:hypothetical protein
MSPTRKPRPPDKGAPPEHKPSRKVALEEIMRSLQDLVSNELATQPDAPKPAAPVTARAAGDQATESGAASQATDATPAETTPGTESVILESLPEPATSPPSALVPEPRTTPTRTVPAGGLQQELPYLDALLPEPETGLPEAAAESPTEAIATTEPSTAGNEADEITLDVLSNDAITDNRAPLAIALLSETESIPAPVEEINWDNIPVLEEAVEMPEEIVIHEADHAIDEPAVAYLPAADTARRLAIQVAARLNVELRKSGQGGLSSDIITRLARLLQEALAKSASNMENTTPDKH